MRVLKTDKIYVDNNSTTPVDPRVKKAIIPYLTNKFGNPSNLHSFGREAKEAVNKARENVAKTINVSPEEIIFTSCGSEGNNLAIKGVAEANRDKGKHIITSKIEHKCVLESCKYLEKKGFEVTYLPVDENGRVSPKTVENALRDDTILVSIMLANNEIGTIQAIEKIGKILEEKDVYFHTDAVQAIGKIPVDVEKLGVDLLTMSGHKIYATKGIGALYVKEDVNITPLIHGGQQEKGLRAGTENVPEIVGFGKACEIVNKSVEKEGKKLTELHKKLIDGVTNSIEDVRLNGHPEKRLPGNSNFCFRYIEGESLVLKMDEEGIACSTGSACASESLKPSHVLLAIGLSKKEAHGSLRLGFGRFNTEKDVEKILKVLPKKVEELRKISPYKKGW